VTVHENTSPHHLARDHLARDIAASERVLSQGTSVAYGPRPARDSPAVTASPLPEFAPKFRKIAGILRSRLARDMATARSQDSSIFSSRSAGFDAEPGA
jgi:hypothetical protein